MDINKFNQGIWEILKNYKTREMTINGYKQYYTIIQLIEKLKNNENFWIGYTKIKGCSKPNYIKLKSTKEFFQPLINLNDEYIN